MRATHSFWAAVVTALMAFPALAEDQFTALDAQLAALPREIDASTAGSGVSYVANRGNSPNTGIVFAADALYWRANRSATPFAGNNIALAGAVGGVPLAAASHLNELNHLDYDWNFGYRVGLGYVGPAGWDVMARYTQFDTSNAAGLGVFEAVDTDAVFANRLDRSLSDNQALNGGFDSGIVDFASESIEVDYDTFDLEMGRWISLPSQYFRLRAMGGLRYAQLLQRGDILYANREGAADDDTYSIDEDASLRGWGPRVGGELHWLAGRGLSLFTRASCSLVYAEFDTVRTDAAFNESLGTVQVRRHHDEFDQIVPITELAVGGRWERGRFFVSGGYDMAVWFDAVQTMNIGGWDDIDGGSAPIVHDRGNFFVDGFFAQAGVTF